MKLDYNEAVNFRDTALEKVQPPKTAFECMEVTKFLMHKAVDNQEKIPQQIVFPERFSALSIQLTFKHLFQMPAEQVKVIRKVDSNDFLCVLDFPAKKAE